MRCNRLNCAPIAHRRRPNRSAPGRPERPLLVNATPGAAARTRQPEGRAALVHAVAHIEFNAINLAWDAVYRFRGKPDAYYRDWASCANDEARHFAMLSERLAELGHAYGDFDAHDGLWEMAEKTAHYDTARMALVPRVLEARGLDVTPGMIERLRHLGDEAHGGDSRSDPARGSRARRRRHALVSLVLRTRRVGAASKRSSICCAITWASICAARSIGRLVCKRGSMNANSIS
jgi:hypothetical protein